MVRIQVEEAMTGRLESLGARFALSQSRRVLVDKQEVRKSGGKIEQTFAECLIEGNRRWWYADFKEPRCLLLGTIHCCVDFKSRTMSCGHGSVLLQTG